MGPVTMLLILIGVLLVVLAFIDSGSVGGIFALIAIFGLYFLPSIVASRRGLPNRNSVFVINFFFGWTLIGWVIPMAMAVSNAEAKSR